MNFYPGRQYDTELVTRWYFVHTGGQVAGVTPDVAEKSATAVGVCTRRFALLFLGAP